MSHQAELLKFLATLVPGETLTFDDAGRQRHRAVAEFAPHPLPEHYEATAQLLARRASEAEFGGALARRRKRAIVREIGKQLGAEGGGFLMVLIAHRAQYIKDPDWRAKQDRYIARLRATGAIAVLSVGGPLVGKIENSWHGICGWER
jgi:hypothetical protein